MGNNTRRDGRIESGQKLSSAISARAWNRAQDAADLVLGDQARFGAGPQAGRELAPNVVLIRNGTNLDVPLLGVLGITDVAITPQQDSQFAWKQLLIGAVPVLATHRDRFVVCLEPISAGAIGRAAIGGMFACKVHVTSTLHRFATVKDGDRTQLQSAACGPMQLVWTDAFGNNTTGLNKWAIGVM
jgi:hypothetical protein